MREKVYIKCEISKKYIHKMRKTKNAKFPLIILLLFTCIASFIYRRKKMREKVYIKCEISYYYSLYYSPV